MPLPFGRGEEEGETPFLTTLPPKKTLQRHPSSITTLPHHHSPTPPPPPPATKKPLQGHPWKSSPYRVFFPFLLRIVRFPTTCRENVLVPLVPRTKNNFTRVRLCERKKDGLHHRENIICLNIQQKESFKKYHLLLGFIATYCVIVK